MTIVKCQNVLNNTDQVKLPQKRTIVEDADPLTNREQKSVAYAPLWGKLALDPAMF